MFDIFVRKLGLIQELGQLIWYLVRNIFMENIYRKYAPNTSAISIFNFGKLHKGKQQMHTRKHIYIYIISYIYKINIYIYVYIYKYMFTNIYKYIYIYICIYINIYMYMFKINIFMYIFYIYLYIYICILYIYIYYFPHPLFFLLSVIAQEDDELQS